jgi:hypothetical protein
VGFFLRVCLGSSCKSFFSFSFFNKTPYYLSKKKTQTKTSGPLEKPMYRPGQRALGFESFGNQTFIFYFL